MRPARADARALALDRRSLASRGLHGPRRPARPGRGLAEAYRQAFGRLGPIAPTRAAVSRGSADGPRLATRGRHRARDRDRQVAPGRRPPRPAARLGHVFATVQTADDAPSKPDPGMLLQAMSETGAGRADHHDRRYKLRHGHGPRGGRRRAHRGAAGAITAARRSPRWARDDRRFLCGAGAHLVGQVLARASPRTRRPDPSAHGSKAHGRLVPSAGRATRAVRGRRRACAPRRRSGSTGGPRGGARGPFIFALDGRPASTRADPFALLDAGRSARRWRPSGGRKGGDRPGRDAADTARQHRHRRGRAARPRLRAEDLARYAGSDLVAYRAGARRSSPPRPAPGIRFSAWARAGSAPGSS